MANQQVLLERERLLNEIGVALSLERHSPRLFEKILKGAMDLSQADGGTLYTITPQKTLHFQIVLNRTLQYHLGGTSPQPIPFSDLPLFLPHGEPNDKLIVAYAVNNDKTIVVEDAYHEKGFDFSGTRAFDKNTGYRTQSVLTVPIKNHENEPIAVLQLINHIDPKTQAVTPFSSDDRQLAESLASQAGVAMTNQRLIEDLKNLFDSLIRVLSEAIDEKSPSTGKHGKRVPILADLLARAVSETKEGPFKDIHFSEDELYELKIATFLHDCGKVTTPDSVVEKRRKLSTIYDRIDLIATRYEVIQRDAALALYANKAKWLKSRYPAIYNEIEAAFSSEEEELEAKYSEWEKEKAFLVHCNDGENPLSEEDIARIRAIGQRRWVFKGKEEPFLTDDELENLSIPKGNLTKKERKIIENHVVMTWKMLSQLIYPKHLRKVPEIAGSHHERVDGSGYPRGLKGDEMSIQARILAISDVFEALSAPDRPYKPALPISQCVAIMKKMCDEGHLDKDLFDVFLKEKVYLTYGKKFLDPSKLDYN